MQVVTYNVLSTALASGYEYCPRECLNNNVRLAKVMTRIKGWCVANSVICLQEISADWIPEITTYLAQTGYNIHYATYGHSGMFGVAILIPGHANISKYSRNVIGDLILRHEGKTPPVYYPWWRRLINAVTFGMMCKRPRWVQPAEKRWNVAIHAEFDLDGHSYAVTNYHMPCAFREPHIMAVHLKYLRISMPKCDSGVKQIVCGDFNLQPHDASLVDFTGGPPRLHSAYAEVPPAYTTKSCCRGNDFQGVLDYVFSSDSNIRAMPLNCDGEYLPNNYEPSDHLPVVAYL